MFEKHKEQKAIKQFEDALATWQAQREGYTHLLEVAQGFNGSATDEIMLKPGEALFYKVAGCSLVEERRGQGHYQGGSAGVSIPIGSIGGHSVRYRVGATRGHYVQGAPVPTAIDTGNLFITNQRVVFSGHNQTRECLFAKTIGISHDDADGETTISVSNRQKPTVIHYGPAIASDVDFRINLAIAHFKGTVSQLVDELRAELAKIEGERPAAPAFLPPPPTSSLPPAATAQAPPPPQAWSPPEPSGPVVPPANHDAGWEYVYFASELARGIQEAQPRYLEYQSQTTEPAQPVTDPAANVTALSNEALDGVSGVDQIMAPATLEHAFGAPGEPGDEAAIRAVAGTLCAFYDEMISWGIKVRSAKVGGQWRPVYAALAKYVSLPLHQFQDFSAALSGSVDRMVTTIRAGQTPREPITLTLTLSIDPNAKAEYEAALETATKAG